MGTPDRAPRPSAALDDWDDHWARYDAAARLNPAQAFRRELVIGALELGQHPGPARLLELGSGQGDLALELLARYPTLELLGLDRSAKGILLAEERTSRFGDDRAAFLVRELGKALELPPRYGGWASHAVCAELLEHVDDPAQVLGQLGPWLAPGARLVVTVPGGPRSAFDRRIGHRRHFARRELRALLEQAGFEVERVVGAGFPAFNLYRLAVIAAGERLVSGAGEPSFAASPLVRATAALLRGALSLSLQQGRLGWQRVAVARWP
jgi:SAM-dependent methyltransferase